MSGWDQLYDLDLVAERSVSPWRVLFGRLARPIGYALLVDLAVVGVVWAVWS